MCSDNQRTLMKPLKLIVQVILFRETPYLLKVILGMSEFSFRRLAGRAMPINYFVILYIALYFAAPFINLLIEKVVEKKCFEKFLACLLILFSIWPTIVDVLQEIANQELNGLSTVGLYGSQWGYSIVNFSLMYIIGAWLRNRNAAEGGIKRHLFFILSAACVLVVWACINDRIGYGVERSAWEYCNPVVIFIAAEVFLLFQQIKITNQRLSGIINRLAHGSFTVFLLHGSFLPYIDIPRFVTGNWLIMVLHLIVSGMVIYFICWAAGEVYEYITRPVYKVLGNKIPMLVKDIFVEL